MESKQEPIHISQPVEGVFPNIQPRLRQLEEDKEILEEKLNHFASEMKSKERLLQLTQNRKEGMESITELLKEARRDLVEAEKRNKTFEIAIKNLQNRLMQNGLNSDCAVDEEDVFIPGPSKQIMDNLVRENVWLKSLSREAEDMQPLKQTLQEYENYTRNLQQEIEELRQKVSQTEGLSRERQMKIEKMEWEIKRLERERISISSSPQTQMSPILSTVHADHTELGRLQEENKQYAAKLNELVEMNKRWKLYNDQQEAKMQKLHTHIQSVKSSPVNEENMQKLLVASRQQLEMTLTEKQQIQEQVNHLDDELKTLQEAFSAQGEDLRQTSEELIQLRINGIPENNDVDALKAQIQICTEDFESERKDRETAQSRLSQVEEENQNLRREINRLQKQVQQIMSASRSTKPQFQSMNIPATPQPNNQYGTPAGFHMQPEMRLNARGGRKFNPANESFTTEKPDGWLMVDGVSPGKGRGTAKNRGDNPVMDEGFRLQCPKCEKEYEAEQHNELLEHIDICG